MLLPFEHDDKLTERSALPFEGISNQNDPRRWDIGCTGDSSPYNIAVWVLVNLHQQLARHAVRTYCWRCASTQLIPYKSEMAPCRKLPSGFRFNGSKIIVCGFILFMWATHVSYGFLMAVAFAPSWRFWWCSKRDQQSVSVNDSLSSLFCLQHFLSACYSNWHTQKVSMAQ